jgi:SLT domain-containing protein
MVAQVLAMLGQPAGLLPNVLRRMNQESGGNPAAINLSDINAQRGDPSKGLMQVISGTFNRWAGPFLGRGIWDPFANIYAGLNYAIHRYPSLQYAMDKPGGYKDGGWLMPGKLGYNETAQPEAVLNKRQLASMGGGKDVHVHFHAPVGSQRELENWLTKAVDNLKRNGRM